jgi:hypothetical protein
LCCHLLWQQCPLQQRLSLVARFATNQTATWNQQFSTKLQDLFPVIGQNTEERKSNFWNVAMSRLDKQVLQQLIESVLVSCCLVDI